jgi:energy-coupling factor transport system substrate-specific component
VAAQADGVKRLAAISIYAWVSLVGVIAFTYPLFLPAITQAAGGVAEPGRNDAPLLSMALLGLSLAALLVELQGRRVNARVVAGLGMLVTVTAALRLMETAIPGPGGFSPIFVPIILAGYVFGARFGFLLGTLGMLASALLTGGLGPWLPYQMIGAGWVGMSAGLLPKPRADRQKLALLTVFGFLWGLAYGALLNLYFWPFLAGDPAIAWEPDLPLGGALARYAAFYLATSLLWDLVRAVGNAAVLLFLGLPVLKALGRFERQLRFEIA